MSCSHSSGEYAALAERVLAGHEVSADQALGVLRSPEAELLSVLQACFRIRCHYFGRDVNLHLLNNAKSGVCSEDCGFCSQAARFDTGVARYRMRTVDEIVAGAREAAAQGAITYCVVTSTREPAAEDLEVICRAVRQIKAELPVRLCVSLGMLSEAHAAQLAQAGVDRYNHNLETSRRHFPKVVHSHTFDDRLTTVRRAKAAGLEACCGGILGLGESDDDRVDLALTLRELEVDSIPVNLFDPRPGTPLANAPRLSPTDCLRALAMFRFVNPERDIRVAGGREANLGALQVMALYPATSLFVNGYLTTGGQGASADVRMIRDAGFRVAHIEPG